MSFDYLINYFSTSEFPDDYYPEDLNFVASCLFRDTREDGSWNAVLGLLENLTEPKKREGVCISIIESAIGEPENFGWFEVLPEILANQNLHWILERGYRYCIKDLYKHVIICYHRKFPGK